MDVQAAGRILQHYVKGFHAGAFAVPMADELGQAEVEGRLHRWDQPGGAVVAFEIKPGRDLRRSDFTGERYTLPAGSRVITHLGHAVGAALPDLTAFDYVYQYVEDGEAVAALHEQGFRRWLATISASSAIQGLYVRTGGLPPSTYPMHDVATLTELPVNLSGELRERVRVEVGTIQGWRDDDAYYHHGEWSQVSLRGFRPDDPYWAVKPSEMSRAWKAEHADWAALKVCDWTTLAEKMPAVREMIGAVPWWRAFERIRLLRLTTGQLTRHTDITDRQAGTRNGLISRFHMPITSHPDVRTVAWDLEGRRQEMHWEPWHLYYLDQRKPHAVVNPSTVERVHLVVDVVTDAEVRMRIGQSARGET